MVYFFKKIIWQTNCIALKTKTYHFHLFFSLMADRTKSISHYYFICRSPE